MDALYYESKPTPKPRPRAPEELDLFEAPAPPAPAPKVRPVTASTREAHAAAMAHADSARERVYQAIRRAGRPLSGAALEALPELADLGTTTARRRAIELARAGRVRECAMRDPQTGRLCAHFVVPDAEGCG